MRVCVLTKGPTGHHPRFARYVVDASPGWASTRVIEAPDGVVPDDASIAKTDCIVHMDGGSALRDPRALHRLGAFPVVAIDFDAAPQSTFRWREPRRALGAWVSLATREFRCRRWPPVRILELSLDGQRSTPLMSSRLTCATVPFRDVVEPLANVVATRWPRAETHCALVGSLAPRKGLAVLAKALPLLSRRLRSSLHVTLAGSVAPGYANELNRLTTTIQEVTSLTTWFGHVGQDDFDALLQRSDVVVLPYWRHRGSSGILASLTQTATPPHVVLSDYGRLGQAGRRCGATMFRDGSAPDLARALTQAITGNAPRPSDEEAIFGSPDEFGQLVWRAVEDVTELPRRQTSH